MGVQNIVKEIKQYQKKWLQHVQRMDTNGLPKQALQYKPKGRRDRGRDGGTNFILRIKEKETRLTLQEHDDDDDDDDDICMSYLMLTDRSIVIIIIIIIIKTRRNII